MLTSSPQTLNISILCNHTVICVILLFVPILLDYKLISYGGNKNETSHILHNSIGSMDYKISICSSIAILFPLMLQILFRVSVEPSLAFSFKKSIFFFLLIIWLISTDISILLYVIPNHDLKLFNVIHQSSYILLINSVTAYLNRYCECKIWRNKITIFTILILSSLRVVHNFALYFYMDNHLSMALTAFSIISLSIILIQSLRCLVLTFKSSNLKSLSTNQILIGIYVSSYFFIATVFLIEISAENLGFYYNLTPSILVSQTCIYRLFYVILVVSQGNLLEREASLNALETKRMFIRYISHEIRTPLNTVMMGLQHLQEEIIKLGECRSHLEIITDIQESCDIAIKTLNDMLLYDKIENDNLEVEKEPVSVVPLVMKIIRLFQAQAAHLGVRLSVKFLDDDDDNNNSNNKSYTNWENLIVSTDPHKLSQIFRNIISNSLKFTPRNGSIEIQISTITRPHTDHGNTITSVSNTPATLFSWLPSLLSSSSIIPTIQSPLVVTPMIRFDVIDSGIGISQENQSKLFHGAIQFSPGKLQNGGGSGLGLYISKGLMDALGGILNVSSEGEGLGSTFTLLLPVAAFNKSNLDKPSEFPVIIEEENDDVTLVNPSLHPKTDTDPDPILSHQASTSSKQSDRLNLQQLQQRLAIEEDEDDDDYAPTLQVRRATSSLVLGCNDNSTHIIHPTISGSGSGSGSTSSPMLEMQLSSRELLLPPLPTTGIQGLISGYFSMSFGYFPRREGGSKILPRQSHESNNKHTTHPTTHCIVNSYPVKRKPVVLIVDDVALNRKMLQRLLTDRCASTIEAVDGQDAVAKVREAMIIGDTMFDIITMDYQMPVMDGVTATQHIRQMGYSGIIVGVTGNALPSDVSKFLMAGANRVLTKPLDIKKMDEVIRQMYSTSW